jgi:hypothetical protein
MHRTSLSLPTIGTFFKYFFHISSRVNSSLLKAPPTASGNLFSHSGLYRKPCLPFLARMAGNSTPFHVVRRIIQSIASPKAEPLKRWLAKMGYDRIQEIENSELAQERIKQLYA